MFAKWKKMAKQKGDINKEEFEKVEKEIYEKYSEEIFEKIKSSTGDTNDSDGAITSKRLWNLKKEIFPKGRDPPTAMRDPTSGNLLTSSENILEAAVNVYSRRLENRPMKDGLKHIKVSKEILCSKLLKVAGNTKTPSWKMKDLEKVLKDLKKQKSRDPMGFANDIFRSEVAGDDLKEAILKLMNKIKEEQIFPESLELCNISSIWKSKGSKNDFESYRGVFRVTVFRSILDRLIYNDEYKKIEANLTDSNVGAQKERNIRDNIFVMNAIINSSRKENKETLDCQVFDIEKCFDSLWLNEVINCLYEAGLNNDKLPLIFMENSNARVAVKAGEGMSRRVSIKNIIMQGSVWGSLCCVVLMDKLGKLVYSNPDLLYYYKGVVGIPPLQMVDDILSLQRCSDKSLKVNTAINTFMDLEKLSLSEKKSHNVHMGNQNQNCPSLKVQGKQMKKSSQEKYLGDFIHKSGKTKHNIEARKAKGYGIVANILAIINEVPLGHWKIDAGLRLRQALFIYGILFNSEAWHDVKEEDIKSLEKVDEALLRGILKSHSKIPIEALYLETALIPIRYIVASRRISYLYNILQKSEHEMVRKVYETQKSNTSQGDFYELVRRDKENLGINQSDREISSMNRTKFKNFVKSKTKEAAFKYLLLKKQGHSKMNGISYTKFEKVQYMNSPLFNSESSKLLLALRTRTVNGIRCDFRGLFVDLKCPLKCGEDDKLQHILECAVLKTHHNTDELTYYAIKYEDIYANNPRKQKQVTELYWQLLNIREQIMNSQPEAVTGPLH